jgi:hypothetical protein
MCGGMAMVTLLTACDRTPSAADRDNAARQHALGMARMDHAARCMAITQAIADLGTPALRRQAAALDLDEIKPHFAARWRAVLKQQASLAHADDDEMAAAIDRNRIVIDTVTTLKGIADDAFDCAGEIERSGNG